MSLSTGRPQSGPPTTRQRASGLANVSKVGPGGEVQNSSVIKGGTRRRLNLATFQNWPPFYNKVALLSQYNLWPQSRNRRQPRRNRHRTGLQP